MGQQLPLYNRRGAFLLETLLATMILGFGLTAVIKSFLIGIEGYQRSQEYQNAAILLENTLTELLSQRYFDRDMIREGNFEGPFLNYRYEISEEAVDQSDALKEVQVQVFWPGGETERSLHATTYMLINPQEQSQ